VLDARELLIAVATARRKTEKGTSLIVAGTLTIPPKSRAHNALVSIHTTHSYSRSTNYLWWTMGHKMEPINVRKLPNVN
jgi:hypothetical protein